MKRVKIQAYCSEIKILKRIRPCPHCHDLSLIPNGAFWICGSCGLAITSAALSHVLDALTQDPPSHNDALATAAVGSR